MKLAIRAAIGTLLASFALAPSAALAHAELETSEPEAGSTIKKPIDHVLMTFSETPGNDPKVKVFDGCGDELVDEAFVQGKTLHTFLTKKGEPGEWLVTYRLVSAEDGHPSVGDLKFTVSGTPECGDGAGDNGDDNGDDVGTTGSDDDPGPQADGEDLQESSFPTFAVAVGALALIGIAILIRLSSARK